MLSDIHGDREAFERILSLTGIGNNDRLYILGDVIDKGKYGIELLQTIREMPQCILLPGNHEYMMWSTYKGSDRNRALRIWQNNSCEATMAAFERLPEEAQESLLSYLASLPVQMDVEVGGRAFTLVHAAPMELYETENRKRRTRTEFALWHRMSASTESPGEKIVIFGHVPTMSLQVTMGNMRIFHGGNKIRIDCGCGYPWLRGQLGCLRLEDMTEFYSIDGIIAPGNGKERE